MRISKVKVTPLAIPDPPLRNIFGVHEPYALRALIQVYTDNGLVGVSEGYGDLQSLAIFERAGRLLVGADPYQIEPLRQLVNDLFAFSAIEVALLDLIGKATGRPVCDLLGGRLRDEVEWSAYLFYKFAGDDEWGEVMTPEAMVRLAQEFQHRHGFRAFKIKGGVLPPEQEVETLRQMRAALGPDARLRIDPNAGWTVETAVKVANDVLPVGVDYLEDPVGGALADFQEMFSDIRSGVADKKGMEAMAVARAKSYGIPYATNMCVTTWEDIPSAFRIGAIDVLLIDHHFWGGLLESVRLTRAAHALGWKVSMHSNTHLGVSLAAMLHLAAAAPYVDYALDTHYPWLKGDILVGEGWKFHEGKLRVPTAPGLGVDVDEVKVAELHENYLRTDIRQRDDVGWMKKKYDPTWESRLPRW